ncbi:Lrp/AsnC family transcriptional regulator [Pikeienuella piscinae]|uniref:Lrp/AsnC family transcriptional regulator n=1 Tax=Pikeienuella piscinae TaxID=2748098 RepID=A0A7L5C1Q1_9RHOB|nr:Lrp/AsnC family transcriptional regulator [Pikeienuella piscinae]QIE57068.1 Lrp/AsnC family transcriptional regulator [Pikeienuella piscinae]
MSEEISLDIADRAILDLLQRDSGATLDRLSEVAHVSSASAWRRVKALEAAGVITARVALVNPAKVERRLCVFADVSLHDHDDKKRTAFERFIAAADEVMECHSTAGGRDYLLKIRVRDVAAYEAFLMERLLAHPSVASAVSSFSLRELKFTTALPI